MPQTRILLLVFGLALFGISPAAEAQSIVTLLSPGLGGNEYTIGSPSQAEAIILDFRDLVFSDSFETDLE